MANAHRGEIDAELDGKRYRLCLTLAALAELEAAFGATDMLALAARFETGRITAHEIRTIIAAGLRGAGYDIADTEVGQMQTTNGAAGFVDIVSRLLLATFGDGSAAPAAEGSPSAREGSPPAREGSPPAREGQRDPVPFPGTT